jgi:hypothetical protein
LLLYVQVTNVLKYKKSSFIWRCSIRCECNVKNYVENGTISTVDAGGYDLSWQNYFEKRRVFLGVKYSF